MPPSTTPVQSSDAPYVVIANVQTAMEEAQICSFLEANGIPVQVQGAGSRRTYGIHGNGVQGVQISVPREQVINALDLLARADDGEFQIDGVDDETSS